MHEILRSIPCHAFILDLAAPPGGRREPFVRADAAAMPFPIRTLDAVVCSRSLEHFENLDHALSEIGRVVKKLKRLLNRIGKKLPATKASLGIIAKL